MVVPPLSRVEQTVRELSRVGLLGLPAAAIRAYVRARACLEPCRGNLLILTLLGRRRDSAN